ncbi:hypothetical protein RhiirB3_530598 [Rhizophagus irregularis]|nr:hypothetical protein RhiirB3_530598 [Rhizophagus irregularis]
MAITVFGRSVSAFNLILFYVLKELGLSYEFVQTTPEEVNSPDYLATKHPFGRTPSLNDDGFQIYETRAIARDLWNKRPNVSRWLKNLNELSADYTL